jgi:hypothetical protein
MTGTALAALVFEEVRLARLRLPVEVRRNSIGLFLLLHSDWVWCEGIGGRTVLARDPEVRRHEASIAVLPFHSRVPRIGWHLDDGTSKDLWLPPRCPAPVVAALVAHAVAVVARTARRAREARRRLRKTGMRLSDFATKPSYSRRTK